MKSKFGEKILKIHPDFKRGKAERPKRFPPPVLPRVPRPLDYAKRRNDVEVCCSEPGLAQGAPSVSVLDARKHRWLNVRTPV